MSIPDPRPLFEAWKNKERLESERRNARAGLDITRGQLDHERGQAFFHMAVMLWQGQSLDEATEQLRPDLERIQTRQRQLQEDQAEFDRLDQEFRRAERAYDEALATYITGLLSSGSVP